MEIPDAKNKMMDGDAIDNKAAEQPAAERAPDTEYFYPESNGYRAMSVRAATKAEADALYEAQRKRKEEPK